VIDCQRRDRRSRSMAGGGRTGRAGARQIRAIRYLPDFYLDLWRVFRDPAAVVEQALAAAVL